MSNKPIPTFPENPWGKAIGAFGPNRQRCINPAATIHDFPRPCQAEARIECGFCHLILFCSEQCRIACQAVHNNVCIALRVPPPAGARAARQVPEVRYGQQLQLPSEIPPQPVLKTSSQTLPNNPQPQQPPNPLNQSYSTQNGQTQNMRLFQQRPETPVMRLAQKINPSDLTKFTGHYSQDQHSGHYLWTPQSSSGAAQPTLSSQPRKHQNVTYPSNHPSSGIPSFQPRVASSSVPVLSRNHAGQQGTVPSYISHHAQVQTNSYRQSTSYQIPTPAPTPAPRNLQPVKSKPNIPHSGTIRDNNYRVPTHTALWLQQQAENSDLPGVRRILVRPATATYPAIAAWIEQGIEAPHSEITFLVVPWAYPENDLDQISEVKHWGPYPIPSKGPRVSVRGGTAKFPLTLNPEVESDDEYRYTEKDNINKKPQAVGAKSEGTSRRRLLRKIVDD